MLIVAALLTVFAFELKIFLPHNSNQRYPVGWPIGTRYYCADRSFFRIFFGLGIFVALIASFRALLK
jgi:hypothetical protein